MGDRPFVSWITRGSFVLVVLALGPGVVSAHDVAGSRFDAPLPLSLLFAGAGATVALTALWLAVTERSAAQNDRRWQVVTVPASLGQALRYGMQAFFVAGVGVALVLGYLGRQVAAENFATVFTWPVWFRGLALLAILVGNPWQVLSPWRLIYRGLVRLEGRALAVLGDYPSDLGSWLAVAGFVVLIGIIENLTVIPRSPRLTTVIIAVYALVIIRVRLSGETDRQRSVDEVIVVDRVGRECVQATLPGSHTTAVDFPVSRRAYRRHRARA